MGGEIPWEIGTTQLRKQRTPDPGKPRAIVNRSCLFCCQLKSREQSCHGAFASRIDPQVNRPVKHGGSSVPYHREYRAYMRAQLCAAYESRRSLSNKSAQDEMYQTTTQVSGSESLMPPLSVPGNMDVKHCGAEQCKI